MGKCFEKILTDLLKARFSILYISTYEENRVVNAIDHLVKDAAQIRTVRRLYTWTSTTGMLPGPSEKEDKAISGTKDPLKALNFVSRYEEPGVFIFKDLHVFFGIDNRPVDYNIVRTLRDISPVLRRGKSPRTLIITAPRIKLPVELQKEITIVDFDLPDFEAIHKVLDEIIEANRATGRIKINVNEYVKNKLVKAAQGLTLQEAENAFARSMAEDGALDINDVDVIFAEKQQIIKKTGILEFIDSDVSIKDVGGLQNLKNWLKKRNRSWLDEARKYNIPAPKGVLITGVPGCGKSLVAKAISSMWQLPLLRLDMGSIFHGIIGSSEENMRKAIKTAEAVAPSILWIDEIEKGFSGTDGRGDSGTSARIFGTFLTWMQEKKNPVFVIATANNIHRLPPEFLRKGRFDEIFFVDLPTEKEREDIFLLHMVRRLKDKSVVGDFRLGRDLVRKLADISEGYVGAEIEQIVINALFEAFSEERSIQDTDFIKATEETVPLSVTMKEDIFALRSWADVRAVSATAKEDSYDYDTESNGNDQSEPSGDFFKKRGGRTLDL